MSPAPHTPPQPDTEPQEPLEPIEPTPQEPQARTAEPDITPEEADYNELKAALRDITSDEDEPPTRHIPLTLSTILGGDILGGGWFRKYLLYIIMVIGMILVYVSNRYACQREMITAKTLSDTLLDRRYKALTRSAQLKEKTRRSYIEETLTDTTLQTAVTPSYNLKIEE